MQLKIFQISHPIIKLLANNIISNKNNEAQNELYYRHIGFLILYEMLRKNLIIKNLYIKRIKGIDVLDVIDDTIKYIILTNILETYSIITEIKLLLPNIKVLHIEYKDLSILSTQMKKIQS